MIRATPQRPRAETHDHVTWSWGRHANMSAIPGRKTRPRNVNASAGRRSGNSCRDAVSGASPAASASLWQQQLRLPWAILRRRPMTVDCRTGPVQPVSFPAGCVETETGNTHHRGASRACVPRRAGQERAGAGEKEEWPGHEDTAVRNRDPQTGVASGKLEVRVGEQRGCGVRWMPHSRLARRDGSDISSGECVRGERACSAAGTDPLAEPGAR